MRRTHLIAALSALVIVVAAVLIRRHRRDRMTAGIGNMEISGNNPVWWVGSAATGGLFATDPVTPQQLAPYMPQFNRRYQQEAARQRQAEAVADVLRAEAARGKKDKFDTGGICNEEWDPAAVAELQGLGAAQAVARPAEATVRLENAVGHKPVDLEDHTPSAKATRMLMYGGLAT
jgi:hypothetical protein